ncbi:hypothetical protein LG291_16765 [Cytobacillus firmus]|uniref:hypothetical protein n=1 Tax=Cytobacillus firmus TaxID=1399 RepID=UPI00384A65E8
MSFNIYRINPNQTQVSFVDGRFETLTNEELDELLSHYGIREKTDEPETNIIN